MRSIHRVSESVSFDPVYKVFQGDFQSLGNPRQRANTRRFLPAFHLAEINRVQVRFLSQPFLRQLQNLAVPADILADDLLV